MTGALVASSETPFHQADLREPAQVEGQRPQVLPADDLHAAWPNAVGMGAGQVLQAGDDREHVRSGVGVDVRVPRIGRRSGSSAEKACHPRWAGASGQESRRRAPARPLASGELAPRHRRRLPPAGSCRAGTRAGTRASCTGSRSRRRASAACRWRRSAGPSGRPRRRRSRTPGGDAARQRPGPRMRPSVQKGVPCDGKWTRSRR